MRDMSGTDVIPMAVVEINKSLTNFDHQLGILVAPWHPHQYSLSQSFDSARLLPAIQLAQNGEPGKFVTVD